MGNRGSRWVVGTVRCYRCRRQLGSERIVNLLLTVERQVEGETISVEAGTELARLCWPCGLDVQVDLELAIVSALAS